MLSAITGIAVGFDSSVPTLPVLVVRLVMVDGEERDMLVLPINVLEYQLNQMRKDELSRMAINLVCYALGIPFETAKVMFSEAGNQVKIEYQAPLVPTNATPLVSLMNVVGALAGLRKKAEGTQKDSREFMTKDGWSPSDPEGPRTASPTGRNPKTGLSVQGYDPEDVNVNMVREAMGVDFKNSPPNLPKEKLPPAAMPPYSMPEEPKRPPVGGADIAKSILGEYE